MIVCASLSTPFEKADFNQQLMQSIINHLSSNVKPRFKDVCERRRFYIKWIVRPRRHENFNRELKTNSARRFILRHGLNSFESEGETL